MVRLICKYICNQENPLIGVIGVWTIFYIKNMTTINAPAYKGNFLEVFENAAMYSDTINVWTEKGNVVIVSEEEYRNIMETLHITSIPKMKEKIIEGLKTPLNECLSEEEVNF
jgi:PHD/YefM family antitoxin component YafN of YafNO toxin-antitoxin module